MLKKLLWALLGLVIAAPIVAGLAGLKVSQFKLMGEAAAQMVVPPEVVTAAVVREEQWQPRIASVGSVVAVQGTMISTEAEGMVTTITFESGSDITTGAVLAQLDVDIEQAQMREAEAAAALTQASYGRVKQLLESRSISREEFDTAAVNHKQAIAKIDSIKALVARKTLRAPFAGKLGIRNISVGQFLQKGSEVVSLQALDPVYVDFSLPQQRLGEVSKNLKVTVTTDAYPEQKFNGNITAINPDIDPATRNVRVQATLPNTDLRLRPGMFVSVDLILSATETVLFIPETAVQHAPFGDSVFVIEENNGKSDDTTAPLVVRQQIVKLGVRQGDFVAVSDGLKVGDRIVTTGVFKLRQGGGVTVDNKLAPNFQLAPKPENT